MLDAQQSNLDYDEGIEPVHKLKIQNHNPGYELRQVAFKKLSGEGLTARYDAQNQYVAIGCKNGQRLIYDTKEHKIVQKYNCANGNPVTTLKWRPMINTSYKTLVTADSEGILEFWHIPTLKKLFYLREEENTINTVDFNRSATLFATGGKDCNIRVYEQQTKSVSVMLKKADWNNVGHDNRVFALKFIDDTTLISGGWDSVIHIWDIRQGKSVRHIYGSNLSGESLDYQDGKILAGCYSAKDQVQIWDYNKGTILQTIDWTKNIDIAAYVYAAGYSKYDIGLFGVGSTGADSSVRLYRDFKNKGEYSLLSEILGINEGCFAIDFSHKKSEFAFTTAHHGFYVYEIVKK